MSASKRKGTAAETAIVRCLVEAGWPHAERRALIGAHDKGDVAGIPGVVIEAKNCSRDELPAWLREAETERANAGADLGVVWHKIRGTTDPRRWPVTMTGEQFLDVLRRLGYHPEVE